MGDRLSLPAPLSLLPHGKKGHSLGFFDPDPNYSHYNNTRRLRELADEAEERRLQEARDQRAWERAEAKAVERERRVHEAAAEAERKRAWLEDGDGDAFAAWSKRATKLQAVVKERDSAVIAAFTEDIADAFPPEVQSKVAAKSYSPEPPRQKAAGVFGAVGFYGVLLVPLVALGSWVASWFGVQSGGMTPWLIGAAAVTVVCIVLALTVGDKAWSKQNDAAHTDGIAERTKLFGFDPLTDKKRTRSWHTDQRPDMRNIAGLLRTGEKNLVEPRMLPRLDEPVLIELPNGHRAPRVAALLEQWREHPVFD
jgi:hypothetical protein